MCLSCNSKMDGGRLKKRRPLVKLPISTTAYMKEKASFRTKVHSGLREPKKGKPSSGKTERWSNKQIGQNEAHMNPMDSSCGNFVNARRRPCDRLGVLPCAPLVRKRAKPTIWSMFNFRPQPTWEVPFSLVSNIIGVGLSIKLGSVVKWNCMYLYVRKIAGGEHCVLTEGDTLTHGSHQLHGSICEVLLVRHRGCICCTWGDNVLERSQNVVHLYTEKHRSIYVFCFAGNSVA